MSNQYVGITDNRLLSPGTSKMKSIEELEVFKKVHILTLKLYKITASFPQEEKFGLISQIRRASSSVGANLIEGSHRINKKEFRQFVGIARGSIGELKYHLLLAKDLGYIKEDLYRQIKEEINIISKMLYGLIQSLTHTDNRH